MVTKNRGFTLLELLIALFIFTILSMILVSALHSVIETLSRTELNAERLRKLQMTLLVLSRDIEQTVNRPVLDTAGNEEAAFIGTPQGFSFTHLGFVNLAQGCASGGMQRTRYFWAQNAFWRMTWPVLDQAPDTKPHGRPVLNSVIDAKFKYLDHEGKFQDRWPVDGQINQPLPRAIRVVLTIANWGEINQLYVLPAQPSKNSPQKTTTLSDQYEQES